MKNEVRKLLAKFETLTTKLSDSLEKIDSVVSDIEDIKTDLENELEGDEEKDEDE